MNLFHFSIRCITRTSIIINQPFDIRYKLFLEQLKLLHQILILRLYAPLDITDLLLDLFDLALNLEPEARVLAPGDLRNLSLSNLAPIRVRPDCSSSLIHSVD